MTTLPKARNCQSRQARAQVSHTEVLSHVISEQLQRRLQTIYRQAHNRAIPKTPIYQTLYDRKGRVTTGTTQAVRVEYSVVKGGKSKVIQTHPYIT